MLYCEIMLSWGQEWDWLGDPFGWMQGLLGLFLLGLGCLIFRELRIGNPAVNFRPAERNLAVSCREKDGFQTDTADTALSGAKLPRFAGPSNRQQPDLNLVP
jgi:hypothetical protein